MAELNEAAADLVIVFQSAVADLAATAGATAKPKAAQGERAGYTPPQLGVGVDKVYSWIHSGALQASDVSKGRGGRPRYLIAQDAVDAFLTQRQVGRADAAAGKRLRVADDGVTEYFWNWSRFWRFRGGHKVETKNSTSLSGSAGICFPLIDEPAASALRVIGQRSI